MRLTKPALAAVIAMAFALLAQIVPAQDERKPSTPEERAEAVRIARALEADPLGKDAAASREKLLKWLVEVPDISVKVCTSFFKPLIGKKKNYSTELEMQPMFSSAAFVIENPDKATDEPAIYQAGLEGTLKAYEAILKTKPKARWDFLDDLLARRDKGELKDYVMEVLENGCGSN